jgi:hypothetical protein
LSILVVATDIVLSLVALPVLEECVTQTVTSRDVGHVRRLPYTEDNSNSFTYSNLTALIFGEFGILRAFVFRVPPPDTALGNLLSSALLQLPTFGSHYDSRHSRWASAKH